MRPGLLRPVLFGAGLLRAGPVCTSVRDGLCAGLRDELRSVVLLPAGVQLHRGAGVGDPAVGLLHDRFDGSPGGRCRNEHCEAGGEDRREHSLNAVAPSPGSRSARVGQSLRAGVSLRRRAGMVLSESGLLNSS